MANEEHLDILRQGVEVWNKWRQNNLSVRPDLSGEAFFGDDLSGADLSQANLSGADLVGDDLRRADLRGARLDGADLFQADLNEVDLSGADLSRANLIGAVLFDANLSGVGFRGADLGLAELSGADLRGANLHGADLSQAHLTGVNLRGADLGLADLFQAHLDEVDLSGADLSRANLRRVFLRGTVFANVDLSQVQGLEEVRHGGPSYVDIHTLYKSQGKIPDVFLRGVGAPEEFITYIGSLVGQPIEFYSCFISYSHQDKPFARRLHDALQGRGIRCWLDEKQLLPGDNIYSVVDRGIRLWDKVLLCCSHHSLTSWWVDNEINTAFDKEQRLWRERQEEVWALIPLNLDGHIFSDKWRSGKKTQLMQRLAADFTGWEQDNAKFEAQFERVVKALQTQDGGREPPPVPKL